MSARRARHALDDFDALDPEGWPSLLTGTPLKPAVATIWASRLADRRERLLRALKGSLMAALHAGALPGGRLPPRAARPPVGRCAPSAPGELLRLALTVHSASSIE